jgi:riboflavin synthase
VFTGIIEEVGIIQELRFLSEGAAIIVAAKTVPQGLNIGDSVAVNGVCLTATQIWSESFICDVSAETLRRSNLKQAKPGAKVNLERSLMVGGRLGGHFVQGHVDDVGRFIGKLASGEGFEMTFGFPRSLERYLVYKGSIAINGISLTISVLEKESFSVSVIPHTFSSTNLGQLMVGDPINLEVDILGKYFERYAQLGLAQVPKEEAKITMEYLKGQGF